MGLGGAPAEADEYEWVRLADLPRGPVRSQQGRRSPEDLDVLEPLAEALCAALAREQPWLPDAGHRLMLVDLDNLRADPLRWRARMAAVVWLARQADESALAGQRGAVARAYPHLAEYADRAQSVRDGSDVADRTLLRAAQKFPAEGGQTLVVSNDGIFADLADRGPLIVVSPGDDALSDRLRAAATRLVDLDVLERAAAAEVGDGRSMAAGPR